MTTSAADTDFKPITDPALVNALIEKHVNSAPAAQEPPAVAEVTTEPPGDDIVSLPGGYIDDQGEVHTEAEVRELTGADEEALAKVSTPGRILLTLLERATVRVGSHKATPKILESMLAGDREALLLGIRIATFGPTETFTIVCPHCQEQFDREIDFRTDVPVRRLEDPYNDRSFEVTLRKGRVAEVSLPTGISQKKVATAVDKTNAELTTLLLTECVDVIAGLPVLGAAPIQALPIADRETLAKEIADRNCGPRLGEVKVPCQACGESIDTPLALATLFRI